MSEPDETVDLTRYSKHGNVSDASLEVYTSEPGKISGLFGDSEHEVDRYILEVNLDADGYAEERRHNIRESRSAARDEFTIQRETDSTELDPRVLEEMHPSIKLGGGQEPAINLELRDPTILIPQEDRVEEGREIYLRTREGSSKGNYVSNEIPEVEATIQEKGDRVTYTLSTKDAHSNSPARLHGISQEEYLDVLLDSINMPDWQKIVAEHPRQRL